MKSLTLGADTAPAGKKATNITLSADVLAQARELGINISRECDNFLRTLLKTEREKRWKETHAPFIKAYNDTVEQEGLPLTEWRSF